MIKKDIYIIKNKINNKVYIGQAKNTNKRFISHCKKSSAKGTSLIDKAIQKYGINNFWYEILESQIENYNEKEKYWILKYNSVVPYGYNLSYGGEEPPVHYGINHPLSTFNNIAEVISIKNDLKYTTLSLFEIAKKHNTTKRTVMRINQGEHYNNESEEYPIRKVPLDSFKLDENSAKEIINILKTTYKQYKEIAMQFNISITTVKEINSGRMWFFEEENYPIRKYKNSGEVLYTHEQIKIFMCYYQQQIYRIVKYRI